MKFLTFILAVVFLVAPTQAHIDVVAFDAMELHANEVNFSEAHQISHHEHDSDDEKQTEHHHHCVDLSVSFAYFPTQIHHSYIPVVIENKLVDFYKVGDSSMYLNSLFQPPRVV